MELKFIFIFFLFFIHNLKAFILNKKFRNLCTKYSSNKNRVKLSLKINDIINFKNKKDLKKDIIKHSKKLCLDLNDEQIKIIENNLYEFFYYLKLKNINIDVKKRKSKYSKLLPLCVKEKRQKKFHTTNLKKENDYFIVNSNSFSN
ncbi:conserved Plasmodium protein, unknown function [Plasmodium gallinaceum]|uniref:Uncharacterized protein n=1 Tax=Plasmodium gallinaceum TaxID=5849 RepID=A0A1J1H3P1_PLAGA|nr:conserved Plasmodium protein, unknown function [Plasmodium gallinaceum]CRG98103.1 conserved Plasmodium protein, unknown function [Plasmodium gallinaceum]